MIARLRELADRPIADAERRRVFAAVAVLIVLAAVLLSATGQPRDTDRSDKQPARPPRVVEPIPAPPPQAPDAKGVEGSAAPSGNLPAPVERAARRFLAGYLAYLYGAGEVAEIEAASPALERRLRCEPPRVSPATRRRDPRVVALAARRLDRGRYLVTATVADGGVAEYPIELTLARRDGRWRVTSTVTD